MTSRDSTARRLVPYGGWMMSRRAKFTFVPVFLLAFVNFFIFIAVNSYIGGDALNGHATNGHYYLGSHGKYTEVTRAVWTYSYWHTISIFVTHGATFFLAILFLCTGDLAHQKKAKSATSPSTSSE